MKTIPPIALNLSLIALLASGAVVKAADNASSPAVDANPFASLLDGGEVVALRPLTLKQGTDAEAFERYVAEVYTPALDRYVPGLKAFVMKGDRGKDKGGYVLVWVFDSADTRDFYYPTEHGEASEAGTALFNQLPESSFEDYIVPFDTTTVNFTDYVVIE